MLPPNFHEELSGKPDKLSELFIWHCVSEHKKKIQFPSRKTKLAGNTLQSLLSSTMMVSFLTVKTHIKIGGILPGI